jgi:hypothetical protein
VARQDEEPGPGGPQGLVDPFAHVADGRHGSSEERVQLTEDRDQGLLALVGDGGGQEHAATPTVGELEDHASGLPGAIDEEDVSALLLELPRQEGEALQVDSHRVEREAVGEPLERPGRDRDPTLREVVVDLGELLVGEEPFLADPRDEVEGVRALRRRDGLRGEDPAPVPRAVSEDLGDGEETVRIDDGAGDGLQDVERAPAVRGAGVRMGLPSERPRVIQHAERSVGGGGCR